MRVAHILSGAAFDVGNWPDARAWMDRTYALSGQMLGSAFTQRGREEAVWETARYNAKLPYSLVQQGEPGEALVRLEQSKARLRSESLRLDDLRLSAHNPEGRDAVRRASESVRALEGQMRTSDPARARELAEELRAARAKLQRLVTSADDQSTTMGEFDLPAILQTIPEGGALVAPVFSSQGSVVFVVPGGAHCVEPGHVLPLPITESDLRAILSGHEASGQLGGWLGAYSFRKSDPHGWRKAIEESGRALWEGLMRPVHERLFELGLAEGAPVVLLPQGGLGVLPLHAAWRELDGRPRAFLDDFTVIYAPSARALGVCQQRLNSAVRGRHSLLAVVDPTGDLPWALAEGRSVAGHFAPASRSVLERASATPEAVAAGCQGSSYLHFACHGRYDWDDAARSGLILAGGQLTLADVLSGPELASTRLVALSACETGISRAIGTPDEYVGLPGGFLQAGAPAVIGALWPVPDDSTAAFFSRFYQLHLSGGLAPAAALRQAQRWLRDATAKELSDGFVQAGIKNRELVGLFSEPAQQTAPLSADDRPFAHPFYWAAFQFYGA
jgi:CHAT domain-containing protein